MNPYTYFAYLCLLENNSTLRSAYKRWKVYNKSARNPTAQEHLKRIIGDIVFDKRVKAKLNFIYEQEKVWTHFDSTKFIDEYLIGRK